MSENPNQNENPLPQQSSGDAGHDGRGQRSVPAPSSYVAPPAQPGVPGGPAHGSVPNIQYSANSQYGANSQHGQGDQTGQQASPDAYGQQQYGQQQYGQQQYGQGNQYGQQQYGQPYSGQYAQPYPTQQYGTPAPQPSYGENPYGQAAQSGYFSNPAGYNPYAPQEPVPGKGGVPMPMPFAGLWFSNLTRPLHKRVGRFFIAAAIVASVFGIGQLITIALMGPIIMGSMDSTLDPESVLSTILENPFGFLALNLAWGVMIPGSILAMSAYGDKLLGFATSVVGKFRWRLAGKSALVIAPLFMLFIGSTFARDNTIEWVWDPNWLLLIVILISTPLQCAGEEYTFRGWMTQSIGGWFSNPIAGVVVSGLVTGAIFGALHGHTAISATLQLMCVGWVCSALTWRTGGLEAAIVLHTCNNLFIMVPMALFGGFGGLFVTEAEVGEDWLGFGIAFLTFAISYALVHVLTSKEIRVTSGVDGAKYLTKRPQFQAAQPWMNA
ncbi:CPBP family intramembrane glutamic endopeptidase [Humidisolicoccus flavus]|uniref:CPBP family intramembrane glutamic endopeptidase n=1 Tax=Humidisolicoccus flavus TaxID=3111414 RepID=UPI00324ACA0C